MLSTSESYATLQLSKGTNRIVKRLLDLFILYLISDSTLSGYGVRKGLASTFGVRVSYGTLYPMLHRLEIQGLIRGSWVAGRKNASTTMKEYSLTEEGRTSLSSEISALSRISLVLQLHEAGVEQRRALVVVEDLLPNPLKKVEESLVLQGYEVKSHFSARGKSGAEHILDLLAHNPHDEKGRILIGVSVGEKEVGISEVIRLSSQAHDFEAGRMMLVATPKLGDEANKLARFYEIEVFEGTTLENAVNGLLETVRKNVSQPPQEVGKESNVTI